MVPAAPGVGVQVPGQAKYATAAMPELAALTVGSVAVVVSCWPLPMVAEPAEGAATVGAVRSMRIVVAAVRTCSRLSTRSTEK